jgi:hypothetical protein
MRKTNVHDTNNYKYTCEYCYGKFVPKRRRVQKYCSNSCRSKAYHVRKNGPPLKGVPGGVTPTEKMSLAGVGNAAAGTAAVTILANLLTKEENKPATKGDLNKIAETLKRYHKIINLGADPNGRLPYFDLETKMVVYKYENNF